MDFKEHKKKQRQTTKDFDLTLRCNYWLNRKLVLQHAHPLNAQKTPLSIADETQFGADGPKKHVISQTALTQCA